MPQRDQLVDRAPPRSRSEQTAHIAPWVAATLTSGFIGGSAAGAETGLAFNGRYFTGLARLSAFPPSTAASSGDVSAELSAIAGALGGCAGWPSPSITLQGCLALEAGIVRAHSSGARLEGSATAPWLALNPALALTLPISRPFAVRAELGALLPFDAARFDVTPLGTLYATARIAPRASLGIAVTL